MRVRSHRALSRLARLIFLALALCSGGLLVCLCRDGLGSLCRLAAQRIAADRNSSFLRLNCEAARFHPELNLVSGVCASVGFFVCLVWFCFCWVLVFFKSVL